MALAECIQRGVISFLEVKTRDDALCQLVDALIERGGMTDKKVLLEAILKREKIVSTGIGLGVAIPHAKLPTLNRFFLAIGLQRAKGGIEWNAHDGAPVRLIFLVIGPTGQQTEYLRILSYLTSAIKDEERRMRLVNAKSEEEVMALLQHPSP